MALRHLVVEIETSMSEEDDWDHAGLAVVFRGNIDPATLDDLDDLPDGVRVAGALGMGVSKNPLGELPDYMDGVHATEWYATDLKAGGQTDWVTATAQDIPAGAMVTAVVAVVQAQSIYPPNDFDGLTEQRAYELAKIAYDTGTHHDHPWFRDLRYTIAVDVQGRVAAMLRARGLADGNGGVGFFTGTIADAADYDIVPGVHAVAHFLDAALDRLMALETA